MNIMNIIVSVFTLFTGPLVKRCCIYLHERRHWKKAKEIHKGEKGIIILSVFLLLKKKYILKKGDLCIQISHKECSLPSGLTLLKSDYLDYTDDEIVQIAHSGKAGCKSEVEKIGLYAVIAVLVGIYLNWSKAYYILLIYAVGIGVYEKVVLPHLNTREKEMLKSREAKKVWFDEEIEKAPGEFKKYMIALSNDDNLHYNTHALNEK